MFFPKKSHNPLNITWVQVSLFLVCLIIVRTVWNGLTWNGLFAYNLLNQIVLTIIKLTRRRLTCTNVILSELLGILLLTIIVKSEGAKVWSPFEAICDTFFYKRLAVDIRGIFGINYGQLVSLTWDLAVHRQGQSFEVKISWVQRQSSYFCADIFTISGIIYAWSFFLYSTF